MPEHPIYNQGVNAHQVNADVMAVGAGARASKTIHGKAADGLRDPVEALRNAIDALALPPPQRAALEEDVAALHGSTGPDPATAPTHLKSLTDKLKMVGVVLGDVAALAEPARRIAEAMQVPLHMLGL